jgi:hypothetical protein
MRTRVCPPLGESLDLEIRSDKIESSTLTIQIDTPDDRRTNVNLDLQVRRQTKRAPIAERSGERIALGLELVSN